MLSALPFSPPTPSSSLVEIDQVVLDNILLLSTLREGRAPIGSGGDENVKKFTNA